MILWPVSESCFPEDFPDSDPDYAGNVAILGFSQTLLIYATKWFKSIQMQVDPDVLCVSLELRNLCSFEFVIILRDKADGDTLRLGVPHAKSLRIKLTGQLNGCF
tara:strand:- start:208 stop:522 length:315 start_codon:yes stop_codon:yes gene_type:complete